MNFLVVNVVRRQRRKKCFKVDRIYIYIFELKLNINILFKYFSYIISSSQCWVSQNKKEFKMLFSSSIEPLDSSTTILSYFYQEKELIFFLLRFIFYQTKFNKYFIFFSPLSNFSICLITNIPILTITSYGLMNECINIFIK